MNINEQYNVSMVLVFNHTENKHQTFIAGATVLIDGIKQPSHVKSLIYMEVLSIATYMSVAISEISIMLTP